MDSPMEPDLVKLYKTDKEAYAASIKEWVTKYAM